MVLTVIQMIICCAQTAKPQVKKMLSCFIIILNMHSSVLVNYHPANYCYSYCIAFTILQPINVFDFYLLC